MEATPTHKPRRFLRATQVACGLALLACGLHLGAGLGGDRLAGLFNDYLYNALVLVAAASCILRAVRVPGQRAVWALLGAGLVAWAAAEFYYSFHLTELEEPPYPSPSDALWLSFYPATYIALALLVRARMREARASLWLDGIVAALAVAAVGEIWVFSPMAEASLAGGLAEPKEVATDLAYPIADLVLLALVMGVFSLTAWRPGRAWTMIGLGLIAMSVGDSIYAYQASQGTYTEGTILDVVWPAATLLVGFAAWEPSHSRGEIHLGGWRMLVLPVLFALPSLGVLVYDHWHPVDTAAIVLAAACLLVVIVRTAMTFGENMRMLSSSQREALTDALTGLGNRRRLMADLAEELERASAEEPRALALFDLDGFKRYNDNFGHPAGDALLARLGHALKRAVEPDGRAYRLGGDEFCVLVRGDEAAAAAMIAAASGALSEQGQGFFVTASHGLVLLPLETAAAAAAMQIADQRLYGHKGSRRSSAVGQQTRDVLLQVLHARKPDLSAHLREVAQVAIAVGRRMRLTPEQLDQTARAAELHDIGKMAVPDEILNKPGPLDEHELEFVRQHTIVGERILAAAPALADVAKLVRSSHESYDGTGYPDGLAGEAIPVPSRIIAVCDAFHAMTQERPYQPAMSLTDAMAELRRYKGMRFDPEVVEAICAEIEAGGVPPVADWTAVGAGDEQLVPIQPQ